MFIFPLEQNPYYQNYAFREKFLSPEECERVLILLNQYPLKEFAARKEDSSGDLRKSRASALPWTQESAGICQRLAAAVVEANKSLYNFNLTGIVENLQIDEYGVGQYFDWHQDFGFREQSIHKLNIVVQLSDPNRYQGGDLELQSGSTVRKAPRSRGAITMFPSFVPQRITPVTSGVRHSLVGWVSGPPFR